MARVSAEYYIGTSTEPSIKCISMAPSSKQVSLVGAEDLAIHPVNRVGEPDQDFITDARKESYLELA